MSDFSQYVGDFDSIIRSRGNDYFRSNRVKMISCLPGKDASLKVYGTRTYDVRLRLVENKKLITTCTCPYFEGGYTCKHAWASVLEANKNNFFQDTSLSRDVTPGATLDVTPGIVRRSLVSKAIRRSKKNQIQSWRQKLDKLGKEQKSIPRLAGGNHGAQGFNQRIGYIAVDQNMTSTANKWVLRFYTREYRKTGGLGVLKSCSVDHDQIALYGDELDRRVLWTLLGQPSQTGSQYGNYYYYTAPKKEYVYLESTMMDSLFMELSTHQKLLHLSPYSDPAPLQFEDDPLHIHLNLSRIDKGYVLTAQLKNNARALAINAASFYVSPYLLADHTLIRAALDTHEEWFHLFKKNSELFVPDEDVDSFLDFYFKAQQAPELTLPECLELTKQSQFDKVRFTVEADPQTGSLLGQVEFQYGNEFVSLHSESAKIFNLENRTLHHRNIEGELGEVLRYLEAVQDVAGTEALSNSEDSDVVHIPDGKLQVMVEQAFNLGWEVVAFKKKVSQSRDFTATISSGIDWFDLSVDFKFDSGFMITLPQLLQNIKSGQRFVSLADGTTGIIRDEWIKKFGNIGQAGTVVGSDIRLTKIQALFYGADLSADKNFKSDRKFKTLQKIIDDINNVTQAPLDPRFQGRLRGYQKKGLSWLSLLAKHEIGGILADDMGLGKTIQILATLSKSRKEQSLIVAPKSLVYNWINEAKKFAPHLKFHDHTGLGRMERLESLEKSDVIVTTYQTFRLDIDFFKDKEIDYFILDEAHYIKNSESQAYMACKLIKAKKKIALTGTPVENSLKDLFSILSVVTPGLISDSLVEKYSNEADPETIQGLARSLRPFILRRTKEEVLKDLPQKSEQVLYCDLMPSERKKYNELKSYYWNNLNSNIQKKGFKNSKIEILEALLRLRQASCHPGLLNKNLSSGSSAKFDLLLEQLVTIIADGHKALIFSQFTSLLGLLGETLKTRHISFEYLDGKTSNRAERVKNFQENDSVKVFLISLKAGGVGLNLTSADYVFILDPWWNPAAESQAIDRAHRFGQKKKVFAYKLIAKDTVEEKILALQEQKRALAKAVVSSEKSLLKGLKMEDLAALFS